METRPNRRFDVPGIWHALNLASSLGSRTREC